MSKRPPRKPVQARSKSTVEAIIVATFHLVAEQGLQATTAQLIADRAGVGIGSFYEYFGNKEEVFAVLMRRLSNNTVGLIQSLIPELVHMEIRDAIRLMLYRVGDMLQQNNGLYLKCVKQGLRSSLIVDLEPIQRVLTDVAMQYLLQHPQYLQARNTPVSIYIFIHGGMHAFIHHLNETNPVISHDQLVDGLANMIGHYVEREMQITQAQS